MLRVVVAAVCAASVAAAASAQVPKPAQPGTMVTVEGCVTKDDRPMVSSAASQYVLVDHRPASAAVAAAGASSGATAAGQVPPARPTYALRAHDASIDLDRYIGRAVRATGATTAPQTTAPLAGRSPEATPHPAPTGPPGSTGTIFDTANLPTLAVTAIVATERRCS
ncbi:MAG: hypothetical protein AB7U83_01150 [Vicinamibacterales bacterium]